MLEPETLQSIRDKWDSINVDGDQYITLEEMYAAQLFDLADKDNEGTLDEAEFFSLCQLIVSRQNFPEATERVMNKQLQDTFKSQDVNGDGMIDKKEFNTFLSTSLAEILLEHAATQPGSRHSKDMQMARLASKRMTRTSHTSNNNMQAASRMGGRPSAMASNQSMSPIGEAPYPGQMPERQLSGQFSSTSSNAAPGDQYQMAGGTPRSMSALTAI